MLFPNDYLLRKLIKQRQLEHETRARMARLLKESRVANPGRHQPFLSRFGELLIQVGFWLKSPGKPRSEGRLAFQRPLANSPCDLSAHMRSECCVVSTPSRMRSSV